MYTALVIFPYHDYYLGPRPYSVDLINQVNVAVVEFLAGDVIAPVVVVRSYVDDH